MHHTLGLVDDAAQLAHHVAEIDERGYTVLENVIEPDLVDALHDDLLRLERELDVKPSPNSFEGSSTIRIYNLLARGAVYAGIPTHEKVLPVVDGVLDPGCLISSLSSISILPGETPQPIHADDQLIPLGKPHEPIVCNTMWALTDFTEANGATRLVPGSHRAHDHPEYGGDYESVPAVMARGSVLVWNGSLWHGGGANATDDRRVGIAMNYCAGFIRQQENQQLGLPRDVVASFSPRLRELCGFGIYRGLIGHIDKRDPAELLGEASSDEPMIWDHV